MAKFVNVNSFTARVKEMAHAITNDLSKCSDFIERLRENLSIKSCKTLFNSETSKNKLPKVQTTNFTIETLVSFMEEAVENVRVFFRFLDGVLQYKIGAGMPWVKA